MVPSSLIIINACHRTLKTHLNTAVQTEPIFSLLFTILHLSGLWKTLSPVYNCRFAPESPSPEVLNLDLSSMGHLVLPWEISFSKSQSSVSMLTRKGQKGGTSVVTKAGKPLWFTADILHSTAKGQLYLLKYLFSIYHVQGNEQGSRRALRKNN